MNRRRYLAALLGGAAGGIAGCAGAAVRAPSAATPTRSAKPSGSPIVGADGDPADICDRRPQSAMIPAIVAPSFGTDWDDAPRGPELEASTPVVGIERNGEARAYPVSLLGRYEIVNDAFDVPVLVTYCPLCASGLTAVRRVDGRETVFENTSLTWRPPGGAGRAAIESDRVFGVPYRDSSSDVSPTVDPNLVMFDRATGSYWSQLLARAICGPLTGEALSLVPSTVASWEAWRRDHPDTVVLLPPPLSATSLSEDGD